MIILGFIVGGLLLALMGALLWVLHDFRKYKKKNRLVLLLLFLFPSSLFAQLLDKNDCQVSFRWYDNQQGKLEHVENDCVFGFIPDELGWTVSVSNYSSNVLTVDWNKVQLVINGFASGVFVDSSVSGVSNESISTVSAGETVSKSLASLNPQDGVSVDRMYDVRKLKKGIKSSITIVLPISMNGKSMSYISFDFVTECKR